MTKREQLAENDPELLFADGFDNAILGIVHRCGMEPVVCYDQDFIIKLLISRDGLSEEDAIEHFDFNIAGAYVGPRTPMFLSRIGEDE